MKNIDIILIRKPEVLKKLGISKSTFHIRIAEGLIPPPIPIGDRAVAWIAHEIQQVIAAMVAGKTKDKIRALVTLLVEQRQELLGGKS